MSYSAANRKDIRAAEKAQLLSLVIRGEVMSGIMQVQNGRQWMHELLASLHIFTDPFNADPYIHAANSGQRGIGIQLQADILTFCPKQFTLMIEEHHGRSAAADERTGSKNPRGRDQAASVDDSGAQGGGNDYHPYGNEVDGSEARN